MALAGACSRREGYVTGMLLLAPQASRVQGIDALSEKMQTDLACKQI